MPQGKGTYGSKVGRPKKKKPMAKAKSAKVKSGLKGPIKSTRLKGGGGVVTSTADLRKKKK